MNRTDRGGQNSEAGTVQPGFLAASFPITNCCMPFPGVTTAVFAGSSLGGKSRAIPSKAATPAITAMIVRIRNWKGAGAGRGKGGTSVMTSVPSGCS